MSQIIPSSSEISVSSVKSPTDDNRRISTSCDVTASTSHDIAASRSNEDPTLKAADDISGAPEVDLATPEVDIAVNIDDVFSTTEVSTVIKKILNFCEESIPATSGIFNSGTTSGPASDLSSASVGVCASGVGKYRYATADEETTKMAATNDGQKEEKEVSGDVTVTRADKASQVNMKSNSKMTSFDEATNDDDVFTNQPNIEKTSSPRAEEHDEQLAYVEEQLVSINTATHADSIACATPTEQITSEIPADDITSEISGDQITSEAAVDEIASETHSDQTTSEMPDQITSNIPTDNITCEIPADDITSEISGDRITSEAAADKIVSEADADEIVSEAPADQIVSEALADKITSKIPTGNIISETPDKQITCKIPGNQITSETPAEQITSETPANDFTSEILDDDITSETPIDDVTNTISTEQITYEILADNITREAAIDQMGHKSLADEITSEGRVAEAPEHASSSLASESVERIAETVVAGVLALVDTDRAINNLTVEQSEADTDNVLIESLADTNDDSVDERAHEHSVDRNNGPVDNVTQQAVDAESTTGQPRQMCEKVLTSVAIYEAETPAVDNKRIDVDTDTSKEEQTNCDITPNGRGIFASPTEILAPVIPLELKADHSSTEKKMDETVRSTQEAYRTNTTTSDDMEVNHSSTSAADVSLTSAEVDTDVPLMAQSSSSSLEYASSLVPGETELAKEMVDKIPTEMEANKGATDMSIEKNFNNEQEDVANKELLVNEVFTAAPVSVKELELSLDNSLTGGGKNAEESCESRIQELDVTYQSKTAADVSPSTDAAANNINTNASDEPLIDDAYLQAQHDGPQDDIKSPSSITSPETETSRKRYSQTSTDAIDAILDNFPEETPPRAEIDGGDDDVTIMTPSSDAPCDADTAAEQKTGILRRHVVDVKYDTAATTVDVFTSSGDSSTVELSERQDEGEDSNAGALSDNCISQTLACDEKITSSNHVLRTNASDEVVKDDDAVTQMPSAENNNSTDVAESNEIFSTLPEIKTTPLEKLTNNGDIEERGESGIDQNIKREDQEKAQKICGEQNQRQDKESCEEGDQNQDKQIYQKESKKQDQEFDEERDKKQYQEADEEQAQRHNQEVGEEREEDEDEYQRLTSCSCDDDDDDSYSQRQLYVIEEQSGASEQADDEDEDEDHRLDCQITEMDVVFIGEDLTTSTKRTKIAPVSITNDDNDILMDQPTPTNYQPNIFQFPQPSSPTAADEQVVPDIQSTEGDVKGGNTRMSETYDITQGPTVIKVKSPVTKSILPLAEKPEKPLPGRAVRSKSGEEVIAESRSLKEEVHTPDVASVDVRSKNRSIVEKLSNSDAKSDDAIVEKSQGSVSIGRVNDDVNAVEINQKERGAKPELADDEDDTMPTLELVKSLLDKFKSLEEFHRAAAAVEARFRTRVVKSSSSSSSSSRTIKSAPATPARRAAARHRRPADIQESSQSGDELMEESTLDDSHSRSSALVSSGTSGYSRSTTGDGSGDGERLERERQVVEKRTEMSSLDELAQLGLTHALLARWRAIEEQNRIRQEEAAPRRTSSRDGKTTSRGNSGSRDRGASTPRDAGEEPRRNKDSSGGGTTGEEGGRPPPLITRYVLAMFRGMEAESQIIAGLQNKPPKKKYKWEVNASIPPTRGGHQSRLAGAGGGGSRKSLLERKRSVSESDVSSCLHVDDVICAQSAREFLSGSGQPIEPRALYEPVGSNEGQIVTSSSAEHLSSADLCSSERVESNDPAKEKEGKEEEGVDTVGREEAEDDDDYTTSSRREVTAEGDTSPAAMTSHNEELPRAGLTRNLRSQFQ